MPKSSSQELQATLQEARVVAPLASRWQHKKGGLYMVTGHVIDADNGEVRIEYQRYGGPNYDPVAENGIAFVRNISEWTIDRFVRLP